MITFRECLTDQVLRMGQPTSKRAADTLHEINNLAHQLAIAEYYRDSARRAARAHKRTERRALCLA